MIRDRLRNEAKNLRSESALNAVHSKIKAADEMVSREQHQLTSIATDPALYRKLFDRYGGQSLAERIKSARAGEKKAKDEGDIPKQNKVSDHIRVFHMMHQRNRAALRDEICGRYTAGLGWAELLKEVQYDIHESGDDPAELKRLKKYQSELDLFLIEEELRRAGKPVGDAARLRRERDAKAKQEKEQLELDRCKKEDELKAKAAKEIAEMEERKKGQEAQLRTIAETIAKKKEQQR